MTFLDAMAARERIALAEEAVSRLLAGIETGDAAGRSAQAYRDALRRHGGVILRSGGPEALAAATDRLSAIPGREADRRAVLTRMWVDLETTTTCIPPAKTGVDAEPGPIGVIYAPRVLG